MVNNGRKEKRKQTILAKERIDGEGRQRYIKDRRTNMLQLSDGLTSLNCVKIDNV